MNEIAFTHCLKESDIDVDVDALVDPRSEDVVLRSVVIKSMKTDRLDIVKLLTDRLRDELSAAALKADEDIWSQHVA